VRIAFDYRILSLDRAVMTRGIPRHTQQQLRELLRIDADNEYILLYPSTADPSLILPEIVAAPNVSQQHYPWTDGRYSRPDDPGLVLRKTDALEQWLVRERIDVYHTPAAWLAVDALFPALETCAVVTTLYDLIPLLFPESFPLPDEFWQRRFDALRWSTRIVAISEHTRRDALRYLALPAGQMDVAYPVADPAFDVLAPDDVARRLDRLRRERGLPPQFLLTVTFVGFATKNVELLLAAYARLPPAFRRAFPLVSAGYFGPPHDVRIRALLDRLGIADTVIIIGVVTDEELAALYNAATLVVVPSRYEGFGLPLVEAMRCGAPVVASNTSSFPEVVGGAGVLVAADDPAGLAEAVASVAESPARRATMREAGFLQAQRFSGERLGRALLATYERAVADHAHASAARPARRIAVWTHVPPEPGAAARGSVDLVDSLAMHGDVELFVDDNVLPDAALMGRYRAHHYRAFDRCHARAPFDAIVYRRDGPPLSDAMRDAIANHGDLVIVSHADGAVGEDAIDAHARAVIVHHGRTQEPVAANVRVAPPGARDARGLRPQVEREAARDRLRLPPTTTAIGVLADGEPPDSVLDAVAALADRLRDVQLVMSCEVNGRPARALAARVRKRGLRRHVRWAVPASVEQRDDHLLACDLLVCVGGATPSAMPAAFTRALSIGRPIVAVGAVWPAVTPEACQVVPLHAATSAELARVLLGLVLDPDRQASMSRAARVSFERHFTIAQAGDIYREIIDTTISSRVPPPNGRVSTMPVAARTSETRRLPFNKACEIEDFDDPELASIMRDVLPFKAARFGDDYPRRAEDRKDWEVAMAVRTLRTFGALRADAAILGVAAGMEDTLAFLSTVVREVSVVDRYLQNDCWANTAPPWMLLSPDLGARMACRPERLRVEHMDGRRLRFADETFDGIFSSGSIEHFGGLLDLAHAAYEMGRVLKPGGVLTLSTELLIAGAADSAVAGTPGLLLLRPAQIRRYIIEASGLEPVDDLRTDVSPATRATRQGLLQSGRVEQARRAQIGIKGAATTDQLTRLPRLVIELDDMTFGSVHVALRKPERRTAVSNAWARPSARLDAALALDRREFVAAQGSWPSQDGPRVPRRGVRAGLAGLAARVASIAERGYMGRKTLRQQIEGWESEAYRLAREGTERSGRDSAPWRSGWTAVSVRPRLGPPFEVVVDRETADPVSRAFLEGSDVDVNAADVDWILALAGAGAACVDLGAHVGSLTFPLAAAGCRVLAIEASPVSVALLRAGVARNGFRHVHVVHAAAADAAGTAAFLNNGAEDSPAPSNDDATDRVPAVRVDDVIDLVGWDRIGAIRLALHGAEVRALRGLTRCLSRPEAPPLFYDSSAADLARAGDDPGTLTTLLEDFGYRCYRIRGRRLQRVRPDDGRSELRRHHVAVKGRLDLAGVRVDER
jgi:FkbM family methyltransferase